MQELKWESPENVMTKMCFSQKKKKKKNKKKKKGGKGRKNVFCINFLGFEIKASHIIFT